MKTRYLIPLVVVGLVGCEPEPRDISTLTVLNDGVENGPFDGTVVSPENQKPYSGPVFSGEDNWNGRLDDGLFHGPVERYHENGRLETKGSFSNGKMDGPFESYYENGQLWSKGSFSNGEQDGPYEEYHENGQLMLKGTFSNGEGDGPFESYDENGQLMLKGTYSNGEQCGEWIEEGETLTYDPCPNG